MSQPSVLARLPRLALALSLVGMAAGSTAASAAGTVNIYSYRQPDLIKPVLDAFTEATGISTRVLFIDKGLEDRIAAEGINSPADLILSVDIGRLVNAKEAGVTQPIDESLVAANVPPEFRDPDGHWVGLTTRARIVYASTERVEADALTYAELADPKWNGRICMRSGQHIYNIGLFAAFIAHWGEEATEGWMKDFKNNLARKPEGSDRAQAKGIYAGECDIALANSYYLGLMMTNEKEPEQKEWAAAVKAIFPQFEDGATHVNISGMALARHAPNKEAAMELIRFLAGEEAQQIYAAQVFEYPVKPGVPASEIVQSFGAVTPDTLPLEDIANNRRLASEIVDRVGLDDGPGS